MDRPREKFCRYQMPYKCTLSSTIYTDKSLPFNSNYEFCNIKESNTISKIYTIRLQKFRRIRKIEFEASKTGFSFLTLSTLLKTTINTKIDS